MVRRSFRLGWRLGALAGFLLAVAKVVQSRRSSRDDAWAPAGGGAWPPVQAEPLVVEPPATTVAERMPPVLRAPVAPPADAAPPMAPAPPVTPAPPVVPPPMPAPAPPPPPPVVEPTPVAPLEQDEPPAPAIVPPMEPDTAATEPAVRAEPEAIPTSTAPAARPRKRPAKKAGTRRVRVRAAWVEAAGSECPSSHPVKAKLSSMLYHLPGMAAYNRTRPDRCYTEAAAAEADGFTRAKR